jgi:hypothetical protein
VVVDAGTLAVVVMAGVAGAATARASRPKAWRDAYESERTRVSQLEKDKAALESDLASIRSRPDMTRLAAMIDASTKLLQAEHLAIIHQLERVADTLELVQQEIRGQGRRL